MFTRDWIFMTSAPLRSCGDKFFHPQSRIFLPMAATSPVLLPALELKDNDLWFLPVLDHTAERPHAVHTRLSDLHCMPIAQRKHGKFDRRSYLRRERRDANQRPFHYPVLFSARFDHCVSHTRICLRFGLIKSQQL